MPWTDDKIPESPYGVICPVDGKQGLSYEEYMKQLNQADLLWKCPGCGGDAQFDEDRYEGSIDKQIEYLFDRTDWRAMTPMVRMTPVNQDTQEDDMAQTQARMTALVGKALDATIKDLGSIDLDAMSTNDSPVECCNPSKVAAVFTGHLCSLLYPKQEPEVKP